MNETTQETAAERDRLREDNAALLATLKWAQARLFVHEGRSDLYVTIQTVLNKAEGREG